MIIRFLCAQARAWLDNGYKIGFAQYGQDQAAYPAIPGWRWYHYWALRHE